MSRVDRLLGLVTYIQSKPHVTAEDIAERFEISVRTVFRDLRALSEQGIPITFEANKGYSLMKGYFLPPVSFTINEANALLLLEQLVPSLSDAHTAEQYSSALEKVKTVLRGAEKESVNALSSRLAIQVPQRLYQTQNVLAPIQLAITHKRVINLHYTSSAGECTSRLIEPVGLIFYAFSWHVIAWCRLRADYRDFKVARITGIDVTDEPFVIANHGDIQEFMKTLPVSW